MRCSGFNHRMTEIWGSQKCTLSCLNWPTSKNGFCGIEGEKQDLWRPRRNPLQWLWPRIGTWVVCPGGKNIYHCDYLWLMAGGNNGADKLLLIIGFKFAIRTLLSQTVTCPQLSLCLLSPIHIFVSINWPVSGCSRKTKDLRTMWRHLKEKRNDLKAGHQGQKDKENGFMMESQWEHSCHPWK